MGISTKEISDVIRERLKDFDASQSHGGLLLRAGRPKEAVEVLQKRDQRAAH